MKWRDARASTGGFLGRFFFLVTSFGEAQIAAGDSHGSMKRMIMREPGDTVKMSFDPGHSACGHVSEINIFSSGFQNSWARTVASGS